MFVPTHPHDPAGGALARCVGDTETFLAEYWSRAPLYRQGDGATGFDDLLSLKDVDVILTSTMPRTPAFRLVKEGKQLDEGSYTTWAGVGGRSAYGAADPGRIYSLFDQGATLVLQALQRYWLPLAHFIRDLELTLTLPSQANAYITPPQSRGLAVHYDTHDVFVLQVSGRKHWDVYEPVIEAPLPSQEGIKGEPELPPPTLTVDLDPGDVLYMPRGWRHAATAQEAASAHLTIGVLNHTWYDVFQEVLYRARDNVAFRQTVPFGFAHDPGRFAGEISQQVASLMAWLDSVDSAEVATAISRRFWAARRPTLVGHLQQLASLDALSDDSAVRRRLGAICVLETGKAPGRLNVLLGDRELSMPESLEPVLRAVLDGEQIKVGELSDHLDDESRLVFVRRLIKEGLLEALED